MRVSQTDTGTQIAAQGLSDGARNGTFNFTITQQTTNSKMYPIRPMRSAQPNNKIFFLECRQICQENSVATGKRSLPAYFCRNFRFSFDKIQYNAIYKVKGKSRHVEQFLKNAGRTVPFKTDFWYTVYRNQRKKNFHNHGKIRGGFYLWQN